MNITTEIWPAPHNAVTWKAQLIMGTAPDYHFKRNHVGTAVQLWKWWDNNNKAVASMCPALDGFDSEGNGTWKGNNVPNAKKEINLPKCGC